jgi:hypothetical protein
LRDAREDIRKLKWAQPAHREATNLYFRIKQAKTEITRLNVEIRRILTYMIDDHIDYFQAIAAAVMTNAPLAQELSSKWLYHQHVNKEIAHSLLRTSQLPGFTGTLIPGSRLGRGSSDGYNPDHIPLPSWVKDVLGLSYTVVDVADGSELGDGDELDDAENGGRGQGDDLVKEVNTVVSFMDNLGIE